jgi:hypothetical protein
MEHMHTDTNAHSHLYRHTPLVHTMCVLHAYARPTPSNPSYGAGFADGGDFRIAFEAASILAAGDTWGVIWKPGAPALAARPPVTPSSTPGCFIYKVCCPGSGMGASGAAKDSLECAACP